MSKKKAKVKTSAKAATRKRSTGEVRFVGAEIPPELDDALESRAKLEMRTKKAIIVLALQKYLAEPHR